MFKYRLIRAMLKVATHRLSVFEANEAPISMPKERFLVFSLPPRDPILQRGLAEAYQIVFGEEPWGETWEEEEVLAKLRRELTEDSFLVLMKENEEWPVVGFSWGAVLPVEALEARVGTALGMEPVGLEQELRVRGVDRILYFDEFAILRQFRGSIINSIRFLLRPGFELGYQLGVCQTLFWSIPAAKIIPLSLYMGYRAIFSIEVEEKEIIFLYNDNFLPMLKLGQNVDWRRIARVILKTSSVLGRQKAGT